MQPLPPLPKNKQTFRSNLFLLDTDSDYSLREWEHNQEHERFRIFYNH